MIRSMLAPALAFSALASATAAQAQQQGCVTPAEVSDAVVYAMPIAYDAARTACANRLSKNGFMATQGEAFVAPFRADQTRAWPGAFRFLKTFMQQDSEAQEQGDIDMQALLSAMPEDAVRPFVDAFIGQWMANEIKGDSCGRIERGMELVSPLPSENLGNLIAFVVEITGIDKPPVCAAAAPSRAAR